MDTFDRLIDRAPPIPPSMSGADVYARFQNEPDTHVLAVVDAEDRPVGLVERNRFFLHMAAEYGRALYAGRPISGLMQVAPLTVEIDTSVEDFCRRALAERASDLTGGFIVTRNGRHQGVGTVVSLLRTASAAAEQRAREATEAAERLAHAEAVAQAAARAKSQFLGVMSHEIRTPLNGVLAVADLLSRQTLPGDGQAYVRTIVDSSQTLMRLLSDAIDLSRADCEGLGLSPDRTPLCGLMDELQELWLPRAMEDGVGLSVTYHGEEDLAAELDATRLKQVFSNLIGNALKFTRRGGVEAGLEAARDGARIKLRGQVRDTGPGLDPGRLSEIFEPFSQSDRAAKDGGYGPGLGLAICRLIMEALGGRIWAENNAGSGAVFHFEFEAPACEAETRATAAPNQSSTGLGGHVLIVDDNATNRMVAQTLVEMFGCTVETAEDGVGAVEAVGRTRFDAILMDIRMPRLDGVGATQAIRALPGPERRTPIVALTANADPEDARRYLAVGMASVVEKPIKADRLLAALSEALTNGQTPRLTVAAA